MTSDYAIFPDKIFTVQYKQKFSSSSIEKKLVRIIAVLNFKQTTLLQKFLSNSCY